MDNNMNFNTQNGDADNNQLNQGNANMNSDIENQYYNNASNVSGSQMPNNNTFLNNQVNPNDTYQQQFSNVGANNQANDTINYGTHPQYPNEDMNANSQSNYDNLNYNNSTQHVNTSSPINSAIPNNIKDLLTESNIYIGIGACILVIIGCFLPLASAYTISVRYIDGNGKLLLIAMLASAILIYLKNKKLAAIPSTFGTLLFLYNAIRVLEVRGVHIKIGLFVILIGLICLNAYLFLICKIKFSDFKNK